MLGIEACREYLGDISLTDKQVENLRDTLYALVENVLDDYLENSVRVELCKKLSSTAASPPSGKKPKDTGLKAKNIAVVTTLVKKATK